MNKSELFKMAHQITKDTIQDGYDYRTTFAITLRILMSTTKESPIHVVSNMDRLRIPMTAWHNGNGWIVAGSFIRDSLFSKRYLMAMPADFSAEKYREKKSAERIHGLDRVMAMEAVSERWY